MNRAWLLALVMAAPCAHAGVYAHVDPQSGMTVLNNVPPAEGEPRAAAPSAPAPRDFPRVSGAQQQQRDGERHAILQIELDSEQQALDTARKGHADGAVLARHAVNIAALKRELAAH